MQPKHGMGPMAVPQSIPEFWQWVFREYGRPLIFIDTGAILDAIRLDDFFAPFLDDELIGFRLVTSTYVVHETVRKMMKDGFVGPAGQVERELALHFLKVWLGERDIRIICIPINIFNQVVATFEEKKGMTCDLTDISSYVIVNGIESDQIITSDRRDFSRLGLQCRP